MSRCRQHDPEFMARVALEAVKGEARAGSERWGEFYKRRRPHTALGERSRDTAYWFGRETEKPGWQAESVA